MRFKSTRAVATAIICTFLGATPVFAASPGSTPIDPADEAHFRQVWNEYGVGLSTQESLLSALRAGDTWDALANEEPVSSRLIESSTFVETVNTYADGSISVLHQDRILNPTRPGGVQPMADIGGCVLVSQAPYINHRRCNVHTNVVVVDFGYTVYFDSILNGYDRITSVGALSFNCYAGTCASAKTLIVRPNESASLAATAEGSIVFNCYGGTCSRRYWLDFFVRKDGYSAVNN
jgi:hypothetical protein